MLFNLLQLTKGHLLPRNAHSLLLDYIISCRLQMWIPLWQIMYFISTSVEPKSSPVDDLMFFSQVAQAPQHCVSDLSKVFLCDLSSFLYDQIEATTVHVLHANVDFSVTVDIE